MLSNTNITQLSDNAFTVSRKYIKVNTFFSVYNNYNIEQLFISSHHQMIIPESNYPGKDKNHIL